MIDCPQRSLQGQERGPAAALRAARIRLWPLRTGWFPRRSRIPGCSPRPQQRLWLRRPPYLSSVARTAAKTKTHSSQVLHTNCASLFSLAFQPDPVGFMHPPADARTSSGLRKTRRSRSTFCCSVSYSTLHHATPMSERRGNRKKDGKRRNKTIHNSLSVQLLPALRYTNGSP